MTASSTVCTVLFLCTGNSARSIMAECVLNRWGGGRFQAFSASSHPEGHIHPLTLAVLQQNGYETGRLRSKAWGRVLGLGLHSYKCSYCGLRQRGGEICPIWHGHPVTAHWGFEDAVAFEGSASETTQRFEEVFRQIESRVKRLAAIPIHQQRRPSFQQALRELGKDPIGPS